MGSIMLAGTLLPLAGTDRAVICLRSVRTLSRDGSIMIHSDEHQPTQRPETDPRLHPHHSHRGGYGNTGTFHTREETVDAGTAGFGAQCGHGGEDVAGNRGRGLAPAGCPGHRAHLSDRKSTRLNSSHLGISYAVFF